MSELLHPELFEGVVLGAKMASILDQRASEARYSSTHPLSLIIRTRNDIDNIEPLFEEISAQEYDGEVEVLLVDTESTDGTRQLAKKLGAEIVSITQDEFTYPLGLNRGMEAASYDAVFVTVGHANLSNKQTLSAVGKHIADESVGGAYGLVLPNANVSWVERSLAAVVLPKLKPANSILKANMGVFAATGAMVRKSAWQE